ncbi:MAG TPA: hypothetical protein VF383_03830, partial [Candidatus Dormibacteraeota bacterium]
RNNFLMLGRECLFPAEKHRSQDWLCVLLKPAHPTVIAWATGRADTGVGDSSTAPLPYMHSRRPWRKTVIHLVDATLG